MKAVLKADLAFATLPFGYLKTDVNLRYRWRRNGKWDDDFETDSETLPMNIAATGLHYGQAAFEGLKVYETQEGRVLSFRLEDNARRMQYSAELLRRQAHAIEPFKRAVHRVVRPNKRFIPLYGTGTSLYVRSLLIGSGPKIGVAPAEEYLFIVLVTPVRPYFKGGFSPTKARHRGGNRSSRTFGDRN